MKEHTRWNVRHGSTEERRLIADGGESENEEGESENEDEAEREEETENEDEAATDEDQEADEDEAESQTPEREEKTGVLYLDLEGLFLDLLGLEVDLDEVVLDVRANPGDDKLLGNLLSAVSGLLDGPNPKEMLSDLTNGLFDFEGLDGESMSGYVRGAAESVLDDVPIEEFISQFVTELVRQLTESSESEGGAEEASG